MAAPAFLRRIHGQVWPMVFKAIHLRQRAFRCPLCGYRGPFETICGLVERRQHARCPRCRALERHRLMAMVLAPLLNSMDTSRQRLLHVAPERQLGAVLRARFGRYESADLFMPGVDHRVDLRAMPFPDASFDMVIAAHVLEHIREDHQAVAEIRRILRPGGIAILPVPIIAPQTVEYPEPNPAEGGHVRAPGADYYNRLVPSFTRVELRWSQDVEESCQPFIYEDRSRWPDSRCPYRPAMAGSRHADVIPICWA
jgi:SAM-dependent methyltransferase